jgi:hypothetical protein
MSDIPGQNTSKALNFGSKWKPHTASYNDPYANFERLRGRWTDVKPEEPKAMKPGRKAKANV